MLQLIKAELRDSWAAWLGVSLTFIATGFALGLASLVAVSAYSDSTLDKFSLGFYGTVGIFNVVLVVAVGLSVVNSATSLVVASRRGSFARLALAGATPKQIVGSLVGQIAVVSALASILGLALAASLLPWTATFLLGDRGESEGTKVLHTNVNLATVVIVLLGTVFVAVLGGYRQARLASKIPPVEALRQAVGNDKTKFGIARIIGLGIVGLIGYSSLAVLPGTLRDGTDNDAVSMLMQTALLMLALTGVVISLLAPLTIKGLTFLWTAIIPVPDASWHLARKTVIAKSARLAKSVVPVMFTVGLLFGLTMMGASMDATVRAMLGDDASFSGISLESLLALAGLPIAVALSGSVGNLVMMGRARAAELAMDSIVGATPTQQVFVGLFEAFIVTITATLLGLVMSSVSLAILAIGVPVLGLPFVVGIPWGILGGILLVCGLIVTASTLLPSLSSLFQPAPRVIARLIAE